jgi:RNA polymerase sigma-70 factor (ECF subfamily)
LFVQRYGPKILGWCRQWQLQEADAQDVTQEVLTILAQSLRRFAYDPAKGHFRGWLRTVTRRAWGAFRQSRRRAGWGSGDPRIQQLLDSRAEGDDLVDVLEREFELELLEEAQARVRLRVAPQSWEVFHLLAIEGWSGAEVAARFNLKVTAVYMTRSRVQKLLAAEMHRLNGTEGPPEEAAL